MKDVVFFLRKNLEILIFSVHLHRQSPPSLSLMLKCAGRFILYIQIWPNDILQNLILLHRSISVFIVFSFQKLFLINFRYLCTK